MPASSSLPNEGSRRIVQVAGSPGSGLEEVSTKTPLLPDRSISHSTLFSESDCNLLFMQQECCTPVSATRSRERNLFSSLKQFPLSCLTCRNFDPMQLI